MNILQFYKNFYKLDDNKKCIISKLPKFNAKYRNTFCVTDKKIDYDDLSKVLISNIDNNIKITPIPFVNKSSTENNDDVILDYIGVYTIGALECLYLTICSDNIGITSNYVTKFNEMLVNCIRDKEIIQSFSDIETIFDFVHEAYYDNTKYAKIFNIFLSLRNNYTDYFYDTLMSYSNILMAIWILDKRTYWQIFFDIMEFSSILMTILFKDYINDKHKIMSTMANYLLSQDNSVLSNDFNFNIIKYKDQNNVTTINKITNCRAISIFMCMSLYYRLIYNYGYNVLSDYIISYNNVNILNYIDTSISKFLGNDSQYEILTGITTHKGIRIDTNGVLVHIDDNTDIYKVNGIKITKDQYEESVLFSKKYKINNIINTSVNLHYSNITKFLGGVAEMWYLSSVTSLINNASKNELDFLNNKILELTAELTTYKNKINIIKQEYEEKQIQEIKQLKQKLLEAQEIIKSKNETINNLVNKNKELNKFIANIYDDDSIIEDTNNITSLSIEDMIKQLNEFNILLVGGRTELPSKLNELGWNNIKQVDKNNLSTGVSTSNLVDFYIINTKFISHPLYYKIISITNPEYIINFNGTNPQKLVEITYNFITKFFENTN